MCRAPVALCLVSLLVAIVAGQSAGLCPEVVPFILSPENFFVQIYQKNISLISRFQSYLGGSFVGTKPPSSPNEVPKLDHRQLLSCLDPDQLSETVIDEDGIDMLGALESTDSAVLVVLQSGVAKLNSGPECEEYTLNIHDVVFVPREKNRSHRLILGAGGRAVVVLVGTEREGARRRCSKDRLQLNTVLKVDADSPNSLGLRIPRQREPIPNRVLNNGYQMPPLGLGTALLLENTTRIVLAALRLGYRMIDMAQGYHASELAVGEAMSSSGISREEVFLITKLHPANHGYDSALESIKKSLADLNTNYIDLFLIHSIECDNFLLQCPDGAVGDWRESWRAMEHAVDLGLVRSLGVSNFGVTLLQELHDFSSKPVSVVQNWFDPYHHDNEVRAFCASRGIQYMGYSVLGSSWKRMGFPVNPVLMNDVFIEVGNQYDFSSGQVILRWAMEKNVTVLTGTTQEHRLAINLRSVDLPMRREEFELMDDFNGIFDRYIKERRLNLTTAGSAKQASSSEPKSDL